MAGRIDKAVKQQLVDEGLWKKFLNIREGLKRKGYDPHSAKEIALGEVMQGAENADEIEEAEGPVDVQAAITQKKTARKKKPKHKELTVAPDLMANKAASEPEIARWVARNIDNPNPDPAECPDPFAWTMLRMCRESPGFATFFIKDVWVKLLQSEARKNEVPAGEEYDGKPTVELIERIQAMRRAAEQN